jgi:hypothetical protein
MTSWMIHAFWQRKEDIVHNVGVGVICGNKIAPGNRLSLRRIRTIWGPDMSKRANNADRVVCSTVNNGHDEGPFPQPHQGVSAGRSFN